MVSESDLKLLSDPAWRLRNFYYIVDKVSRRKILYCPNRAQQYLHDDPFKDRMTLKARQLGVSTGLLLEDLDASAFNYNTNVQIIADKRENIEKLFSVVRFAHANMPEIVRPRLDKGGGSKYQMRFPEINSKISVSLEVTSESVTHLHVSEYGLMKDRSRYQTSVDAMVTGGNGWITIESTPRGMNHFYEDWQDANFPYSKHFFPWYFDTSYTIPSNKFELTKEEKKLVKHAKEKYGIDLTYGNIAWRRNRIAKKRSLDNFLQEYPEDDIGCFLMSGNNVFDSTRIRELLRSAPSPISNDGEGLRVFKKYDRNKIYVIGVDPAEGIGGDNSAATVLESESREQVAVLHGQFKPYEFAYKLNDIANMYRMGGRPAPLMAVERNNHGHAVIQELYNHIKYPNLYEHRDGKLGWPTDRVTRPLIIDTLVDAVDNGNVIINDSETLKECNTLIEENGKIQAIEGKKDDLVMSLAIALEMVKQSRRSEIYNNPSKYFKLG